MLFCLRMADRVYISSCLRPHLQNRQQHCLKVETSETVSCVKTLQYYWGAKLEFTTDSTSDVPSIFTRGASHEMSVMPSRINNWWICGFTETFTKHTARILVVEQSITTNGMFMDIGSVLRVSRTQESHQRISQTFVTWQPDTNM